MHGAQPMREDHGFRAADAKRRAVCPGDGACRRLRPGHRDHGHGGLPHAEHRLHRRQDPVGGGRRRVGARGLRFGWRIRPGPPAHLFRQTVTPSLIGKITDSRSGRAKTSNQYNHYLGDPGYLPKDLERYRRTTTGALQAVAQSRLQKNMRIVVYGLPGQKVIDDVPKSARTPSAPLAPAAAAADQAWRNQPPAPGPASTLKLPVPATFKLGNGLTVFFVEQHNLPIVSANLIVLSGSDRNPISRPGLASFTASMLDEGTKKRSAPRPPVRASTGKRHRFGP